MIICATAKRKKDGMIDAEASADVKAFRDSDVAEISRENDGKVLVRMDDGEPAEYYDAVSIDGEAILGGKLRSALDSDEKTASKKSNESWPKHYR